MHASFTTRWGWTSLQAWATALPDDQVWEGCLRPLHANAPGHRYLCQAKSTCASVAHSSVSTEAGVGCVMFLPGSKQQWVCSISWQFSQPGLTPGSNLSQKM